jgi:hypothetical protein
LSIRTLCFLCILTLCLWPASGWAQYSDDDAPRRINKTYPGANEQFGPPPRYLIQTPTASTLPKGHFDVTVWVFGSGGVLAGTTLGFTDRFQLGVSYGADGFLGHGDPVWNKRVAFQTKLQLVQETLKMPAITLGYDDQGYGPFIDSLNRYTIKSRGVYGVITKNFYTLSVATGFHGGINYSFETDDGQSSPDFFLGWDIHYNREVSVLLEYALGLNDNAPGSPVGKGRGFLNVGFRWEYSRELVLEAILSDLTQNRKDVERIGRELRIVYLQEF